MRCILILISFLISIILWADEVDVYLIAGQSNADGRAQADFLSKDLKTPSDNIRLFINGQWHKLQPGLNDSLNNKWFGPEITFGRSLKKYYPKRNIALVKHALGSTDLGICWRAPDTDGQKAGPCYKKFVKAVKDALATFPSKTKIRIKGMIWMQGETDSWHKDPSMAKAYEKNLTAFLSSIRKEFNLPNLPIVIGRISKTWRRSGGGHGELVRKAQDKVAKKTPDTTIINTDALPLEKDGAHYNTDGQKTLGKRFADALYKLQAGRSVALVNVGTYTYSRAPNGAKLGTPTQGDNGKTGPIKYTSSSILGDGDNSVAKTATFTNIGNRLGTNGITVTFDLGSEYYIINVKTKHKATHWNGIGPVDFSYSVDNVIYTLVGTNGSNVNKSSGLFTRQMSYSNIRARYIKLHCRSVPYYHLPLSEVEIYATPAPEPKLAEHVIVISPNAIEPEVTAANELASFLRQVTKHKYQIIKDPKAAGKRKRIFVGQSVLVKRMLPKVNWKKLGQDGIVLKTVKDDLILAGGRPRGTLYAVYTFLEDVVGCRWWTSTESDIPSKDKLVIPSLNTVYTPTFFYRETLFGDVYNAKNYKFMAQLKLNGHHHARLPKSFGGYLDILGFVHTFAQLLPPSKYYKAHPEWYTGGGKRKGQLCLTNKEVEKELIKNALKWLDKHPDQNIISISQNDGGGGACRCKKCSAIAKREGSQAGPLLHFVNRVAKELEKHRRGVIVETLAYTYTRNRPYFVRPRKNVVIRLCNINADFLKPLNGRTNKKFAADLRSWSRIAPRLFIWDYVVNFSNPLLSIHPNLGVLGPNLRFFAKNNVKGIFEQGRRESANSEFQALKVWMLGHLMWKPFQDDKKLMMEFLNGYYGAAGPFVGKYIKLLQRAFKKKKIFLASGNTDFTAIKLSDMNKADELFSKAFAALEGNAKYERRLALVKITSDRLWISNWNELKSEATFGKLPFSGPKDPQKGLKELVKKAKSLGVLRELGVKQLKEFLKIPATLPNAKKPTGIKLGYKKWFDIQEKQFRSPKTSPKCKIVADKLASDGCAVVMPGNHTEWLVQCDLKHEGNYKYYVIVRYEINKNKPLTGLAFQAGIHPSSTKISIPIKKALDGKYHAYYLGIHKPGGKYIWVAPTRNPAIKGIYIDRIIAVKK